MPCSRSLASQARMILPDLCDGPPSLPASTVEHSLKPMDGRPRLPPRTAGNGPGRGGRKGEVSINPRSRGIGLREKLLMEVGNIASADLAAAWAREALTAKNSLAATDTKLVED